MSAPPPDSTADSARPEGSARQVHPPASARSGARRSGLPAPLERALVDTLVRAALAEDSGPGDVTSRTAVPAAARARARLVAKAPGIVSGLDVFARAFELADPNARVALEKRDGDAIAVGEVLATVEGLARALLTAERIGLNFVQRMSGIATLTARFVALAEGRARVLDTRKTTPGLRVVERYAVRCGGGENHRFGLFDEAMVKENHIELAGRPLVDVLADLRAALGPDVRITSEARDEAEALDGVRGGADVVLLDNMAPETMRALCGKLRALATERGRSVELEASGGVDLTTMAAVARSGVDRVSIGALTHSAPSLDLSLDLEPCA